MEVKMDKNEINNLEMYERISKRYDTFKKMSREEYIDIKLKERKRRLIGALIVVLFIYGLLIGGIILLKIVKNYYNDYIKIEKSHIISISKNVCNLHNQTYIKTELYTNEEDIYCNKEIFKIGG
jgi:hypothetical protein